MAWREVTLFDILGVDVDADEEAIHRAYRRLAKTCHPDVSSQPLSARRFARVCRAYKTLRDPAQRESYRAAVLRQRQAARRAAERKAARAARASGRASEQIVRASAVGKMRAALSGLAGTLRRGCARLANRVVTMLGLLSLLAMLVILSLLASDRVKLAGADTEMVPPPPVVEFEALPSRDAPLTPAEDEPPRAGAVDRPGVRAFEGPPSPASQGEGDDAPGPCGGSCDVDEPEAAPIPASARGEAIKSRSAMRRAVEEARGASSARYARETWNEASRLDAAARAAMEGGEYYQASALWMKAERRFRASAEEARRAKRFHMSLEDLQRANE